MRVESLKVLVLSKYSSKGASSRFRMMQYFRFLQEKGVSVETQELFDDSYLDALYARKPRLFLVVRSYFKRFFFLISRPKCDVVWIEKELFPWIPAFVDLMLLRWLGRPYVLEYDDAVFHSYDLSSSLVIRALLSSKHPRLMKNAKAVVAGNGYLAEKARQSGASSVLQIPTVVSAEKYRPLSTENEKIVIGWIGSPSTSPYLEILRGVFRQLSQEFNIELRFVGAKIHWPELNPTVVRWRAEIEVSEIQKFDVGVMPLIDSPWEKGKCGFKIVQYMACGKPVVASDVGCNSEIILDQQSGFLARTEQDWLKNLRYLLSRADARKSFGDVGRRRFEEKYSFEANRSQVLTALTEAAK